MLCLERALAGEFDQPPRPRSIRLLASAAQRSLVVLISDMLAPIDMLTKQLGYLRSRGHEVVLMQTLGSGRSRFHLSGGGSVCRS